MKKWQTCSKHTILKAVPVFEFTLKCQQRNSDIPSPWTFHQSICQGSDNTLCSVL